MTDPDFFMLVFERQDSGVYCSNVLPFRDAVLALRALGAPVPSESLCPGSLPVRIYAHDNPDGTFRTSIGVVIFDQPGIEVLASAWPRSMS